MSIAFEESMVLYPMPAWCVSHVIRFLDELYNGTGIGEVVPAQPANVPFDKQEWTLEDLRQLKPLIRHNRVAMAILKLLSDNPGQLVSFPEACVLAALESAKGRAGVGALTKVCHKLGKEKWPFAYVWAGNGEQVACYRMSDSIASLWQKVSSE